MRKKPTRPKPRASALLPAVTFSTGTTPLIELTSLDEVELLARAVASKLGASVVVIAARADGAQVHYRYGWHGDFSAVALGAVVRDLAARGMASNESSGKGGGG